MVGFAPLGAAQDMSVAEPAAQEAETEAGRRSHAFFSEVMSPFCPGRTLADCPSPDAGALRQQIRQRLDAGQSEAALRSELEERYGNVVRPLPGSAFGWVFPASFLIAGVGLVVFAFRRMSSPDGASEAVSADPASLDAIEAELDRELTARGIQPGDTPGGHTGA